MFRIHRSLPVCVALALSLTCASSWAADTPKVGDKSPDFELKTPKDESLKLSALTKEGPVVVLVLRGWPGYQCPICNRQVGEFLGQAKKFADAKAQVLMIYPGPSADLKSHADEFITGKTLPGNF